MQLPLAEQGEHGIDERLPGPFGPDRPAVARALGCSIHGPILPRVTRVRLALVAGAVSCVLVAAAPASAQAPAGSCNLTATQGTKQTYDCRYGPITVAPFQVLTREIQLGMPKPDVDGFVTNMETDVIDANGAQVPISRLMLHHIVFANVGKQDRTCQSFTMWDSMTKFPAAAERFYGAGEERAKLALPEGYGYPIKKQDNWLVTYMFMNHRAKTDSAYIGYRVTVETRPDTTPVEPYWLDVENCKVDPVYDVAGGKRRASRDTQRMVWNVPKAGRLIAGGGHVHGGGQQLALSRPDCRDEAIHTSRPVWGSARHPFYRVRPVLHEPGPIHMTAFASQRGVPLAAGEKVLLKSEYDASLPHTRVMGISVVFLAPDPSVTTPCGTHPKDFAALPTPAGRRLPPPFRVPIVGRRGNRAVNIKAPPGKRVRLGRRGTIGVGDLYFRRPNVTLPAGGTLTWRFDGDTLHNITLANGPRGFSSPNLSKGRTYRKKLTVPGTYQLFCGLHPVDMTATVKVVPRRRK
jgi:copper binding plastocyanin/azurin family protein